MASSSATAVSRATSFPLMKCATSRGLGVIALETRAVHLQGPEVLTEVPLFVYTASPAMRGSEDEPRVGSVL